MNFPKRILWTFLSALLPVTITSANGTTEDREAHMKAAYIFNFVKFVEWPSKPGSSPIRVCFSGGNRVGAALSAATVDKDVGGRRIEVKYPDGAADSKQCDVLYSESMTAKSLPENLQSVLTIGDSTSFTRDGGMIRLYTDNNRLRFAVNVDNAKRAGLQVSSHLLKLASHVEQEAAP